MLVTMVTKLWRDKKKKKNRKKQGAQPQATKGAGLSLDS